jgi:hypothetical protein
MRFTSNRGVADAGYVTMVRAAAGPHILVRARGEGPHAGNSAALPVPWAGCAARDALATVPLAPAVITLPAVSRLHF